MGKSKVAAPAKANGVKPVDVKKSKKAESKKVKEPTPETSSDEDSDESDSDVEMDVKTNGVKKANGVAKKAAAVDSDSDDSDDASDAGSDDSDSDSSEDEKAHKKTTKANGVKTNGAAKKVEAESDSDSDSDDSDESDDEAKPAAAEDDDSDDSDSDSDSDAEEEPKVTKKAAVEAESSDDDSDDSDSSESEAEPAPSKKRKAEAEVEAPAKKAKAADAAHDERASKNLFVGSLSWNVDEEMLGNEFSDFGELVRCTVMLRDDGKSKGFGFVEFADLDSAVAAYNAKNGALLDGRPMNVDYTSDRSKSGDRGQRTQQRADRFGDKKSVPSNTLFIGNLSFDCDNNTVSEAFSSFGTISRISLPTDRETGTPKGFGYIDFSSVEEATAAYEAMNGEAIAGRAIRLDYASQRPDNGGSGGGFGGGRGGGRGGFGGRGGGRGGGGFGGRGGGGRGGGRGGFGDRRGGGGFQSRNNAGIGGFAGNKKTFD